jgi:hypothetical protein
MSLVDKLKDKGHTNYNVVMPKSSIDIDSGEFTGTATDQMDEVLKAQSPEMKLASKRDSAMRSVLLMSPAIFEKYEKELHLEFPTIRDQYLYFLNGKFCQEVGCDPAIRAEGVLKYKGHLVVCMDEWDSFDIMTGTKTYRIMAVTPGVFGVAYDTTAISPQFGGLGMRITQHLDSPWKGKIFMDTTFKLGTGIIDETFIVNSSRTYVPAA